MSAVRSVDGSCVRRAGDGGLGLGWAYWQKPPPLTTMFWPVTKSEPLPAR